MNVSRPYWWYVNSCSGDDLNPPRSNSLCEPMLPRSMTPYSVFIPHNGLQYWVLSFCTTTPSISPLIKHYCPSNLRRYKLMIFTKWNKSFDASLTVGSRPKKDRTLTWIQFLFDAQDSTRWTRWTTEQNKHKHNIKTHHKQQLTKNRYSDNKASQSITLTRFN